MLNEKFVEALQHTAVKAAGAELLPVDARRAYLVCDGTVTPIDLLPPPRQHAVATLDDVAAAAKQWDADVCFHNDREIVLVVDDGDRHDRVALTLLKSSQFKELESLQKARALGHRDLLRLLRITFKGCVDDLTIATIRGIDFKREAAGDSYIAPGTEKIGKSIAAKAITQSGSLPEEIRLSIPVYTNQGLTQRFPAVLAFDVDIEAQTFIVQTAPNEVETLLNAITEQIHERLTATLEHAMVLRGSP